MSTRRAARTLFVILIGLSIPLFAVGCAGGKGAVKTANVTPGKMPKDGEWRGVYYSPTYGFLHLVPAGSSITGAWRTAAGDAWGELHGEVEGNLLKYTWTEYRIGLVGEGATRQGKGYFLYVAPNAGEAHEIHGEWGLGENEAGNTWEAIKQVNQEPDPESVKPDEIEGRVQGGGWDSERGGSEEGVDEGEGEGDVEADEEGAMEEEGDGL